MAVLGVQHVGKGTGLVPNPLKISKKDAGWYGALPPIPVSSPWFCHHRHGGKAPIK